jgi:hypothetical protein
MAYPHRATLPLIVEFVVLEQPLEGFHPAGEFVGFAIAALLLYGLEPGVCDLCRNGRIATVYIPREYVIVEARELGLDDRHLAGSLLGNLPAAFGADVALGLGARIVGNAQGSLGTIDGYAFAAFATGLYIGASIH